MATAVALFKLKPNEMREVTVCVPIKKDVDIKPGSCFKSVVEKKWDENLNGLCQLDIPNKQFQYLYDAAIRSLILHSPLDVYPGPYTYKRFWFRDAAFILHTMLCVGMSARAEKVIDRFPTRQTAGGYFLSQDGEWDSTEKRYGSCAVSANSREKTESEVAGRLPRGGMAKGKRISKRQPLFRPAPYRF
jgi:hypothetical protein